MSLLRDDSASEESARARECACTNEGLRDCKVVREIGAGDEEVCNLSGSKKL